MGRQLRKLFGCYAPVALWGASMALVLAACGAASEPETIVVTAVVTRMVPTQESVVTVVETVIVEVETVAPTRAPEPTEASAPTAEPTEPGLPTPTSPGAAVQEELKRLAAGRIAYNPPDEMTVDKTERVEARISMDEVAPLTEGLKGVGTPVVESIAFSCFMRVRLVGDAFDIVAFSSEEQIVPAQGFTDWAWNVTPTKPGEKSLCLIVTALVKAPGAEGQKDLPIIERWIRVKVEPGTVFSSFFRDNRGWIFPAILIPLAAAFGRRCWQWQKRRKQPSDPGTGGPAAQP